MAEPTPSLVNVAKVGDVSPGTSTVVEL